MNSQGSSPRGRGRGRGRGAASKEPANVVPKFEADDEEIPMDTEIKKEEEKTSTVVKKGKVGVKKRKVENDEDSEEIPISKHEGRTGRVSAPRS